MIKAVVFLDCCIDCEDLCDACLSRAGSTAKAECVYVCVCVCVCVGGCSIAATTFCVYILFGAAAAASSSVRGWEEQRLRVCIGYICLHAGKTGVTWTAPRAAKLN